MEKFDPRENLAEPIGPDKEEAFTEWLLENADAENEKFRERIRAIKGCEHEEVCKCVMLSLLRGQTDHTLIGIIQFTKAMVANELIAIEKLSTLPESDDRFAELWISQTMAAAYSGIAVHAESELKAREDLMSWAVLKNMDDSQ